VRLSDSQKKSVVIILPPLSSLDFQNTVLLLALQK
jgi:hypothetical protein